MASTIQSRSKLAITNKNSHIIDKINETDIIDKDRDKEQDKINARNKLGLKHDYKHVVIIGLFTPRKNQKYAMMALLRWE